MEMKILESLFFLGGGQLWKQCESASDFFFHLLLRKFCILSTDVLGTKQTFAGIFHQHM